MELKEGLEFNKRCLERCKQILDDLRENEDIPAARKEALIDKMLDRMNEFQKNIDFLEELIR